MLIILILIEWSMCGGIALWYRNEGIANNGYGVVLYGVV